MKKLLLLAVCVGFGIATAMAVPAKRGVKKTLTLSDGTRVEATLKGDEHVNYYQTADHRAVQMVNGAYRYVNLDSLTVQHARKVRARNQERAASASARKVNYTGQRRGLVIMVDFKDVKFTYGKSVFEKYFNQVGFSQDGMEGSVHDYFLEQSYGKFDLEFDVVGPVSMTYNATYYANGDTRVPELVKNICGQVDSQVDFSKYDWDGDGMVDQVYVIYAGYGKAQGAENTIWPHEWNTLATGSYYVTNDGVSVGTYGISCELRGNGIADTGHLDGIGTSCHEFSHCLGLPDFYDTTEDGTNFGMNVWDLMDYGCYNGDNNGTCPSGYTAYERWFGGWLEPTELVTGCRISDMPALQDEPVAYIMYNDKDPDEYYMLYNHQQKGFDEASYGHGMLVVHVDYDQSYWRNNTVNNEANHQRMTIIPADNALSSTNSSLAGDPFPGTRNKTELTNTSTPKASLYNSNVDGTLLMSKPITNIDETNGLITFDFMGGVEIAAPVAAEATNVTETGFRANWASVNGATKYTINLTKTVDGDDPLEMNIFEEDFYNFTSDIEGSTDISASLDDYTELPGWTGEYLYRSTKRLRVGKASKLGNITSPAFSQPSQNALTAVFSPVSAGRNSTNLEFRIILTSTGQYASGTVSDIDTYTDVESIYSYLMNIEEWTYGDFKFAIYPEGSGVFLFFMAAYNGYYTWDDFSAPALAPGLPGLKAGRTREISLKASDLQWFEADGTPMCAPSKPRKAPVQTSDAFTTTKTYYDFSDLEPAVYTYKVRATTSAGNSYWSDEITVDLTTPVRSIAAEGTAAEGHTYQLDGRKVNSDNLRRGIYIRDGKKFLVK